MALLGGFDVQIQVQELKKEIAHLLAELDATRGLVAALEEVNRLKELECQALANDVEIARLARLAG